MPNAEIFNSSGKPLYRLLMEHVRSQLVRVSQDQPVLIEDTREVSRYIIEESRGSSGLLEVCMGYYDAADLAVSHAVNVAVYALSMGSGMGLPDDDLEDLVIGGLLHDIGFGKVPLFHRDESELSEYVEDPDKVLTEEDQEMVARHPRLGADAILKESDQAGRVADILLQHHEKADGSGYPRGLPEDAQLRPARILSLIDTYEALIHPRPFRDALVPPVGIESIKQAQKGAFSPDLLKELLVSLTLFPVGHFVMLTDGSVGKVVAVHRAHPLRPDVEVRFDPDGRRLEEPALVELRNEQMLGVERALPRFKKGE
ncbi:MAG: HD domain-containing phosphohydrolase [bacterium]